MSSAQQRPRIGNRRRLEAPYPACGSAHLGTGSPPARKQFLGRERLVGVEYGVARNSQPLRQRPCRWEARRVPQLSIADGPPEVVVDLPIQDDVARTVNGEFRDRVREAGLQSGTIAAEMALFIFARLADAEKGRSLAGLRREEC